MDTDDQTTSEILAALACLPCKNQTEAMCTSVSKALKHMSTQRLIAVRNRIRLELNEEIPAVQMTLEIIEGQLALRDIAGGAFWR